MQTNNMQAQFNIERNAGESNTASKELISQSKIDKTPFKLVTTADNGSFIAMGKYKVTENTATPEESLAKLESEKWLIMTNLIVIVLEQMLEYTNEKEVKETVE